jgi:hypothetical protein
MRASLEVADIFRAAGPAYRASHAGHLSLEKLKVMSAIEHCRTAALAVPFSGRSASSASQETSGRAPYSLYRRMRKDSARRFELPLTSTE